MNDHEIHTEEQMNQERKHYEEILKQNDEVLDIKEETNAKLKKLAELLQNERKEDTLTIEKLVKKDKNQKIEINRMDQRIKQLLIDNQNLQQQITKDQQRHANETRIIKEELSVLQGKNSKMINANNAFKLEVAEQKSQIKLLEENCNKLRSQVRNSVDKSIATDLAKDINKLIENKLGVIVQGEQVVELTKKINDIKECQICCEYFDHNHRKPVTTKCGHINCKSCMTSLANSSQKCPDCRAPFRKEDLIPLNLSFDDL